jgi:hypothetical protein
MIGILFVSHYANILTFVPDTVTEHFLLRLLYEKFKVYVQFIVVNK